MTAAPPSGAPVAVASAAPAAAPPSGGGYAVQVTSQRSEGEAQTAFRTLQAKYPNQLSGRAPIIRRADLGEKGTYYRALVGPFASAEEAAGLCSGLKAAGGTCIVQRN
jgi:cell division septation protein DedD